MPPILRAWPGRLTSHTRVALRALLGLACTLLAPAALAVTGVNPFGVNVRSSGPTTVFLTFQGLDAGETPVEAFWCGELQPALMAANPQLQFPVPVQTTNPCVPGTVYGRLPQPLDRARPSTSGGLANLTDIMTIPASVARRAFQDAQAGLNSAFFYVRRFAGPAGERFVVVTCRMAGGGARVPLALTEVRLGFDVAGTAPTVLVLARGQTPPRAAARILYNGSGTLRGRWEVVLPGDPEPSEDDLLTEATLPPERRAAQRRWTVVERFDRFLPPTGEVTLPGPDPARLPVHADGGYKLLLRIEASDDREGRSDLGGGRQAVAGGVAGFAMPVLRYAVGGGVAAGGASAPMLLAPAARPRAGEALEFAWIDTAGAALLRLEVQPADGGAEVLSALVKPGVARYAPPPWVVQAQRGKPLRWRVVALNDRGDEVAASDWRPLIWP
ncbi:MAG: hypothetical protein HZC37_01930 [Burkholderiales bacterium]|nr:hypothetical protein [Burkholderiales bacterium]